MPPCCATPHTTYTPKTTVSCQSTDPIPFFRRPGCVLIAVDPSHHTGFLWPNPQRGQIGSIDEKFKPYAKAGRLMLPAVSVVTPRTIVFVADHEVIKHIATNRSGIFEKDPQTYSVLHVYGHNIVGSDGPEWKKQREAARAAFNEGNVQLVWEESCRASRDAVALLDNSHMSTPPDVTQFLRKATSAFGQRFYYGKDRSASLPPGYTLQFGEALKLACEQMVTLWATPKWLYGLPIPWLRPFLSRVKLSYKELRGHLLRLIEHSRSTLVVDSNEKSHDNLLRRLVEANTLETDPAKRLTDEELLSNVFIFLVAGHETTAHTASFILAHLALYPDVQNRVFEEVKKVWPRYEDIQSAEEEYLLAVFRESLRHFPVAPRLPKVALQDTILHSHARFDSGPGSEPLSIAVPKGSLVVMDVMGANFNPAYWGDDASEFRPERFIDTADYRWPRDAFLAFSLGVRSCIGQRSGQVQTVCILAHLLRRYQVSLPPHLLGLPFEQQRRILLRFWLGASLSPTDIRLTFSRRKETV
ncbi:cytochrome P450 [Hysterangium stoloniferum]|nr:cytochrome P450 [Hysterangium stoloniferum]